MSLREQLLALKENKPQQVGAYFVREMTGTERDAFEQSVIDGDRANPVGYRGKLLCRTLCDETGKRLFSDLEWQQVGDLPAGVLQPLFNAASEMNKLTNGDVEELVKN